MNKSSYGKNKLEVWRDKRRQEAFACACVGPQNDDPLCRCKMRHLGIFQRNGRWIKPGGAETDLGAVSGLTKDEERILRSKYG